MTDLRVNMNQVDRAQISQQNNLRSRSALAVCPKCGEIAFTRSEQKCNTISIVFCGLLPSIWYAWQVFKKKDLNCFDNVHSCTNCNTVLANYQAL